jgi:hypothetical protein
MPQFKRCAVSAITACVLAGGGAGVAQAATPNVTTAIKAQDKAVKNSAVFKSLKHVKVSTPAQAKALIPKYKALQLKLDHAATVVSKAAATGAQQKQGQKDWVGGVRDLAQGIGFLDVALKDAIDGNGSAAKTELAKAQKALSAGDALGTKGDELLGLPTDD